MCVLYSLLVRIHTLTTVLLVLIQYLIDKKKHFRRHHYDVNSSF